MASALVVPRRHRAMALVAAAVLLVVAVVIASFLSVEPSVSMPPDPPRAPRLSPAPPVPAPPPQAPAAPALKESARPPAAPEADGNLPQSLVGREVAARRGAVQDCYERRLRHATDVGGSMRVRFTIGASGQVRDVRIDHDSVRDPSVERCVRGVFERARFPRPLGGPVDVAAPFVLRPSNR